MRVWLQSADFAHRDVDADLDGVLAAFASHDWDSEAQLAERLASEGQDFCPAGLGLVRSDGQILHICPGRDSVVVHWHRPVRVLGFLWKRRSVHTWSGFSLFAIPGAIRSFFGANDAELERLALQTDE